MVVLGFRAMALGPFIGVYRERYIGFRYGLDRFRASTLSSIQSLRKCPLNLESYLFRVVCLWYLIETPTLNMRDNALP